MAVSPSPLRLTLIGAVVGVTVQLALLPAPPALTLTGRQGAIALMGNLRTRPECPVACRAPPALMDASPHTKSAEPEQPSQSMTTTPIVTETQSVGNKSVGQF
jgi:hypothetical protein